MSLEVTPFVQCSRILIGKCQFHCFFYLPSEFIQVIEQETNIHWTAIFVSVLLRFECVLECLELNSIILNSIKKQTVNRLGLYGIAYLFIILFKYDNLTEWIIFHVNLLGWKQKLNFEAGTTGWWNNTMDQCFSFTTCYNLD